MLLDFSEGCHSPRTVRVQARTRMLGVYELAVWQHERRWYWAVLLNESARVQGTARTEADAQRAVEAAARHLSA